MPKKKDILNSSNVDVCGICGSTQIKVISVRTYKGRKQRRKKCLKCNNRYNTIEILQDYYNNIPKLSKQKPPDDILSMTYQDREKIFEALKERLFNSLRLRTQL